MNTVDIQELYDNDPRPTFVVDCYAQPATIHVVNKALLTIPNFAHSLQLHDAFRDWWDPTSRAEVAQRNRFWHERRYWTKFSANKQFLVVTLLSRHEALHEEDSRNRTGALEQATIEREVLDAEVTVLTQEASDVHARLHSMHDVVNKVGVGFFEYDMEANLIYANVCLFEFPLSR